MKIRFAALAGLAAAGMLPSASEAQFVPSQESAVLLYGRLDASVNAVHYSSATTRKTVSSDTSLIGFRGSEDLGGGLIGYFKLEHGFFVDTGTQVNATTFWNRETFVGLRSTTLGGVELGTHWDPFIYLAIKTDPFARAQTGASLSLLQGTATRGYTPLLTNTVLYASPTIGGVTVRAQVAAPEGTGINKNWAGAVDYFATDRLYFGFAFDNIQTLRTTVGLTGAGAVRAATYGLGAYYKFDAVKLSAYGQTNRTSELKNVNGYQVGAVVPVGLGEVRMAWEQINRVGSHASLLALGYVYNLSKRTLVYTSAARLANGSTTSYAMFPSSQDLTAAPPRLGQDLTGFQVGLRHVF
jgi:predicted porin